jgi:hypothetical protein
MDATSIIVEIFTVINTIFINILGMIGGFIEFMFNWEDNPYNVVIAIPLALMIIVFGINIVRRLIDGF